jgi:hypothetical protein
MPSLCLGNTGSAGCFSGRFHHVFHAKAEMILGLVERDCAAAVFVHPSCERAPRERVYSRYYSGSRVTRCRRCIGRRDGGRQYPVAQ